MSENDRIVQGLESAARFDENESFADQGAKRTRVFKVLILAVVAVAIVLGAVIKFQLIDPNSFFAAKEVEANTTAFLELGEMIVNLDTRGKGSSLLKLNIVLEMRNYQDVSKANELLPRATDSVLFYLRGLRPSDLNGGAALYRLREELMIRFNKILSPTRVMDILFKDIVVQ